MDTLSALVIGICGLKMNIVRADVGKLQILSPDERDLYPHLEGNHARDLRRSLLPADARGYTEQRDALRAYKAAVEQSGPTGWAQWMTEMRNSIVHRIRPINLIVSNEKTGGLARPLNRYPQNSEAFTWFTQREELRMEAVYLTEDIYDTMNGILDSLNAAVAAVASTTLNNLWASRKKTPLLIKQPAEQWSDPRSVAPEFTGYQKGTVEFPGGPDALGSLHPDNYVRMISAGAKKAD